MDEAIPIEDLQRKAADEMDRVAERIRAFAHERPHAALGLAFGIGWVLANGVPPRLVTMAASAAVRNAVRAAVLGGGLASLLGALGVDPRDRQGGPRAARPRGSALNEQEGGL